MKNLRIDVWSDIACPWCFVGKRRLEAALARLAREPSAPVVEVVWRAFELDLSAPRERPTEVGYAERLATKYGSSVKEADAMIARMTEVAHADGLDFRFDRIRPGNTFDAHRVLHLAAERGVQDAVKERFLRAYMTEGEPIGDPDTLVRLAAEAGLDTEEVRAALASDAYSAEVRADENDARTLGVNGVPFFLLNEKYAVSGAQPADVLFRALTQVAAELAATPGPFGEGAVCGPDGCA